MQLDSIVSDHLGEDISGTGSEESSDNDSEEAFEDGLSDDDTFSDDDYFNVVSKSGGNFLQ